jgi:hypothetical protein
VPPGANGRHVNKTDRQVESAKAELIMGVENQKRKIPHSIAFCGNACIVHKAS